MLRRETLVDVRLARDSEERRVMVTASEDHEGDIRYRVFTLGTGNSRLHRSAGVGASYETAESQARRIVRFYERDGWRVRADGIAHAEILGQYDSPELFLEHYSDYHLGVVSPQGTLLSEWHSLDGRGWFEKDVQHLL